MGVRCTEWRAERSWVCTVLCTALESVESRTMYCRGSREAAQLVEARPQLVVSTAALRHQLVEGGPGSYSFYGVFGVEGTYVLAGFTCNLLRLWILE